MQKLRIFSKIIFLTSFLQIGNYCYSQNILEGYWGVKGGINVNKISQVSYASSIHPGFHLGVYANFQLNNKFSFKHEVLFSMSGVSLELPRGVKYQKNYSYISLPWSFNFFLNKHFYVGAGIQPSVYAYFRSPKPDTIIYNKDNVNTFDISYLVTASFIGDNRWGGGIRLTSSIFPIFHSDEEKNKNIICQVFIQYAVNKKKPKRRGRK